jgi:hypothetical protein
VVGGALPMVKVSNRMVSVPPARRIVGAFDPTEICKV